jgi:hypothetical protein
MPLRIGTLTPSKLYLGSTEVTKAYLGAVEVYSSAPVLDPDAAAYIAAVEAADTQALEPAVRAAINGFVVGCKADGIWAAIKASCILAGARTLTGALVPLRGTAPTNFNFVSGDYNRKTGLVGNGSTKYLNSNRNNNADPQNSKHIAAYLTSVGNQSFRIVMGTNQNAGDALLGYRWDGVNQFRFSVNDSPRIVEGGILTPGLFGVSRSNSSNCSARRNGGNFAYVAASATRTNTAISIFKATQISLHYDHRIAFYSIGEAIDLALLDSRVSTLITAIDAAIP